MARYIDAEAIDLERVSDSICQWQAQEAIDDAPTADVRENVHATWQRDIIEHGAVRVYEGKWECSNCGYGEDVPTVMGKPTIWHFCPNCGADMRGES